MFDQDPSLTSDLALGDIELKKENPGRALEYYNGAIEKFAEVEHLPCSVRETKSEEKTCE